MKEEFSRNTALFLLTTVIVLGGSGFSIFAATNVAPSSATQSQKSMEPTQKVLKERIQGLEHEAVEAINETENALVRLHNNDAKKSMALLQDVSGKLDILLAKHPGLTLIPAEVTVDVIDSGVDAKQAEKIIDDADELLDDQKVQEARYLLDTLVSELRITTTNIPLGSYPIAIKEAARMIDEEKTKAAEQALFDTLNTVVKTTEIMPLPVLRAESLLTEASELEHQSDLASSANRDEILELIDSSKDELNLAEKLGYGVKDDYEELFDAIGQIKDALRTEKSKAAWEHFKSTLSTFKDKIIHPTRGQNGEAPA